MADDRTLSFPERAYENYCEEMEDIENLIPLLDEKNAGEIDDYREPLSCDERREITILLSWGAGLFNADQRGHSLSLFRHEAVLCLF